MYSFKNGFKRARKDAGYTQEAFCEQFTNYDGFKISLSTVRNWEQGRNVPELKTIDALCAFFRCDMDYLFFRIGCKTHDNQFIQNELGLSETAIDRLRELKEMYPHYIDSLNFLLVSDHFDSALFYICEYSDSIKKVNWLNEIKRKQVESLVSIQDYKPNMALLENINGAIKEMNLNEYNLSTRFNFIIQEIKRKTDAEQ